MGHGRCPISPTVVTDTSLCWVRSQAGNLPRCAVSARRPGSRALLCPCPTERSRERAWKWSPDRTLRSSCRTFSGQFGRGLMAAFVGRQAEDPERRRGRSGGILATRSCNTSKGDADHESVVAGIGHPGRNPLASAHGARKRPNSGMAESLHRGHATLGSQPRMSQELKPR